MKKIRNMKRYMTKYLALSGALLMLASLAGCHLDEPVIPAEELYIRGFIKKYGLIDPTQDFSSAMQTTVTLSLPNQASVVNVYAQMGDGLYRVGCFAELSGTVTLPVDVSEATETILVDIDGVRYTTVPGGSVDVKSGAPAAGSRAGNARDLSNAEIKNLWIDPYKWTSVTKTNGETGKAYADGARKVIFIREDGSIDNAELSDDKDNDNDYETGDAVIKKDGMNTRYFNVAKAGHVGANLFGDKSHETALGINAGSTNPGEVGNTFNGSNVRFLIKNNDDALAAYRFVFRTASKNKGKIRVVLLGQQKTNGSADNGVYVFLDSHNLEVDADIAHDATLNTDTKDKYTEWELRTELMPRGYYELIIMGVDSEANFDGDQTCGNWGYMSMSRMKTAKDMSWILACEDLGTTDDFDFNDVVFSIEAVNTNTAAVKLGVTQWQVVDNNPEDGGTVIRPANAPASRDPVDEVGTNKYKTQVKVTALAAGGTLPIWLHFREEEGNSGNGTDYIVCPGATPGDNGRGCLKKAEEVAAAEEAQEKAGAGISACSEWHRWFGMSNSTTMLNTGVFKHISNTESVTFVTNNVFSLENFCYLKFKVDETEDLPYYFHEDVDLDPWSQKVLQWQWVQNKSQKVTFGFFLTVYKPTVKGSSDEIEGMESQKSDDGHVLSKGLVGLPPQMFLIPDCNPMTDTGVESEVKGWRWPVERMDITNVYPNFTKWVEKATDYYGINWFMLPKTGLSNENSYFYPRDPSAQSSYQPFTPGSGNSGN